MTICKEDAFVHSIMHGQQGIAHSVILCHGVKLLFYQLTFSRGKEILMQLNPSRNRLQQEKVRFSLLVTTNLLSIKPRNRRIQPPS